MSSTRERILEAALACFADHGVAGTTVEQVRAAAGVSTGSLYHHVSGRRHLVAAVQAWLLRDYQEGFIARLETAATAIDGIQAVVRHHVAWCLARPEAARFLFAEPLPARRQPGGDELADMNEAFLRRVLAWLRPHVHYGTVRSLGVSLTYALWLGPAQERCRLWASGRADAPDDAEVEVLADAAARCLLTGG